MTVCTRMTLLRSDFAVSMRWPLAAKATTRASKSVLCIRRVCSDSELAPNPRRRSCRMVKKEGKGARVAQSLGATLVVSSLCSWA